MNLFNDFYLKSHGERWSDLRSALLVPPERKEHVLFQGFAKYKLDSASIRAAQALQVQPGDEILDLCAAPGGKTLILLEALEGKGSLIANELSYARRKRLEEVIRMHVPMRDQTLVKVTGFDGNRFGLARPNAYDRILLDAPCSSERHLLEVDAEMTDWKDSRTKQLAKRQYALLCSALLALKPGGTLVYSTCSISPLENDGVIERALDRKEDQVEVDLETADLADLERSKHGFQIFPDRFNGAGPMYIARLKKRFSIVKK